MTIDDTPIDESPKPLAPCDCNDKHNLPMYMEDCQGREWIECDFCGKRTGTFTDSADVVRQWERIAHPGTCEAAEVEQWRPMDTVPKDGREVLLTVALRAGIPGQCLVGHWMPGGHCIEDHPPIDAGWYFWNGCMFDRASKPIAWMPLPEDTREAAEAKEK